MMNIKKSKFVVLIIVAVLVGAGACFGTMTLAGSGFGTYAKVPKDEYKEMKDISEKYKKLDDLYGIIEKNYYKDIDDKALMTATYKGLFEGLDDPYSVYMTADEYKQWEVSTTGEFDGIGITFTEDKDGNHVIVSVIDGTPAKKAGLKAGDFIIKVDGKTYKDIDTLGSAIRGDSGTKVKIDYVRNGHQKTVSIVRDSIVNKSVISKVIKKNIGYIQITSFEEKTAEDFKAALKSMESKNVKGLVIDLRDNGGGLVDSGTQIADMLLGEGTITYLQDREGKKEYIDSDADATDLPYVMLVNGGTASTSEIVTAAVKDYKSGKIVGTKTYGKGIVQSTSKLADGDAVKLTVMQYFSPKGNKIHKKGVAPDYLLKLPKDGKTDTQLNKAVELLK